MMIKDKDTGVERPYDPDLDYDLPLRPLGKIPPDPSNWGAKPLNPLKDLT